jgi:hypothetical protein
VGVDPAESSRTLRQEAVAEFYRSKPPSMDDTEDLIWSLSDLTDPRVYLRDPDLDTVAGVIVHDGRINLEVGSLQRQQRPRQPNTLIDGRARGGTIVASLAPGGWDRMARSR